MPNPFFGVAERGQLRDARDAAAQPAAAAVPAVRQRQHVRATGAQSQYHAGVIQVQQARHRVVGRQLQLHLQPPLGQPVRPGQLLLERARLLNNYTVDPESPYFNPDAEYGRSLLDSPHKLVVSRSSSCRSAKGHRWLAAAASATRSLGGWTVSFVIQMQSGFPMGVSQNTNNTNLLGHNQRPNVVPGVEILTGGSITDRLEANPDDNLYLNPAAFTQAPQGTIGNAPRYFEGVYSPWRNSTDMAMNKDVCLGGSRRISLRLDIINLFDNPWYQALGSSAVGNTDFGRVTAQANYSRTMQVTARFSF